MTSVFKKQEKHDRRRTKTSANNKHKKYKDKKYQANCQHLYFDVVDSKCDARDTLHFHQLPKGLTQRLLKEIDDDVYRQRERQCKNALLLTCKYRELRKILYSG